MSDVKQILESICDDENKENNVKKVLELIMTKILLENPRNFEKNRNVKLNLNVYDMFEDLCLEMKTEGLSEKDNGYMMKEDFGEVEGYVQKALGLIGKQIVVNAEGEVEQQEPQTCGYMPNLLEESRLFEWVGIYFGKDLTYLLYKSLVKLAIAKQAKSIRFWGKISGSHKDYFIAEGQVEGGEEQELPANWEPRGTGVNKNTYWVTTDVLGEWTELPLISPQHLQVARRIKYVFTGDLERKVVTNPDFPGQEKHLLKTQIVRITHGTQLVPSGHYKVNEEDNKEIETVEAEEQKLPSFQELQKMGNWVHLYQSILKEGRVVHFKPEIGEDEDEEKVMKNIELNDPFEPRLKSIQLDQPIQGYEKPWVLRVFNDQTLYQQNAFVNTTVTHAIISLQSLIWPGSHTIYH